MTINRERHSSPKNKLEPRRLRLRDWLEERIDNPNYPGLTWVNMEEKLFRIPWKHGARHGWRENEDARLFREWSEHTGASPRDVKQHKANFRCALNSLRDVVQVHKLNKQKGDDAYRVYQMLPKKNSRRTTVWIRRRRQQGTICDSSESPSPASSPAYLSPSTSFSSSYPPSSPISTNTASTTGPQRLQEPSSIFLPPYNSNYVSQTISPYSNCYQTVPQTSNAPPNMVLDTVDPSTFNETRLLPQTSSFIGPEPFSSCLPSYAVSDEAGTTMLDNSFQYSENSGIIHGPQEYPLVSPAYSDYGQSNFNLPSPTESLPPEPNYLLFSSQNHNCDAHIPDQQEHGFGEQGSHHIPSIPRGHPSEFSEPISPLHSPTISMNFNQSCDMESTGGEQSYPPNGVVYVNESCFDQSFDGLSTSVMDTSLELSQPFNFENTSEDVFATFNDVTNEGRLPPAATLLSSWHSDSSEMDHNLSRTLMPMC